GTGASSRKAEGRLAIRTDAGQSGHRAFLHRESPERAGADADLLHASPDRGADRAPARHADLIDIGGSVPPLLPDTPHRLEAIVARANPALGAANRTRDPAWRSLTGVQW